MRSVAVDPIACHKCAFRAEYAMTLGATRGGGAQAPRGEHDERTTVTHRHRRAYPLTEGALNGRLTATDARATHGRLSAIGRATLLWGTRRHRGGHLKALRWLLVIPAGVAVLMAMSALFPIAAVGSLDIPLDFWDATDMGEWWFSGTIALIFSRGGAAAFSIWAVFRIAPDHKSAAAGVWAALLVALAVFQFGELIMFIRITGISPSFGQWYRSLAEAGALAAGSLLTYFTYFDMRSSAGDLNSREASKSSHRAQAGQTGLTDKS